MLDFLFRGDSMKSKGLNYIALGKRIKHHRKAANISQEMMAELIDKSVQHISNIERGHTKASLATIVDIANALNVSLNDLACDSLKNSGNSYSHEFSRLIKDCDEDTYRKINSAVKAIVDILD